MDVPVIALEAIGGYIPGKINLAILKGLLAGACYLDMIGLFQVLERSVWKVFHEVITWVKKTFTFPLRNFLWTKIRMG